MSYSSSYVFLITSFQCFLHSPFINLESLSLSRLNVPNSFCIATVSSSPKRIHGEIDFLDVELCKNVLNFLVNKKSFRSFLLLFCSLCSETFFKTKFTLKLCFIMQKYHARLWSAPTTAKRRNYSKMGWAHEMLFFFADVIWWFLKALCKSGEHSRNAIFNFLAPQSSLIANLFREFKRNI